MSSSRRVPERAPAPTPEPPPTPQPQRRRGVAHVTAAAQRSALRISIHGPEKIGKSTWAAAAPSPVFFAFDGGVGDLDAAVKVFPRHESVADVVGDLRSLIVDPHTFESLVFDGMHFFERLVWDSVCADLGWSSIEDPQFQTGYHRAANEMHGVLKILERLQEARGMHVIFLGHTVLRTVKARAAAPFDRAIMMMHSTAAGMIAGWVDVTMSAEWGRIRPDGKRERILRTEQSDEQQAGNRWHLPDPLPLSPPALFWSEVEAWRMPAADLAGMALRLAELLGADALDRAAAEIARAGTNKRALLDLRRALQAELAANNLASTEQDKELSR